MILKYFQTAFIVLVEIQKRMTYILLKYPKEGIS